ncbi:MAG: AAA-like domain-containing protein [Pseudomonadota bacterium]
MRYFNTYGPVNKFQHYIVSRSELLTDIVTQIEQGSYFTIYAPRQMGKTTILRQLAEVLDEKPDYLPLTFTFEAFENAPVEGFFSAFSEDIVQHLITTLQNEGNGEAQLTKIQQLINHLPTDILALRDFFRQLVKLLPNRRLVLIIDEFDGTPQAAISGLLQTWREVYLTNQPPRTIHSVVLIGIQNIATLNLGRSSPFNIARELQLSLFTLPQVQELMSQYTTETGQIFEKGVIEEIHRLTSGYPFLVNRLALIITEEIATERTQAISHSNLHTALKKLVRERSYNYESLTRHASEFQEQVLRIMFGARLKFTLNTPWINALNMHGVIMENAQGFCEIANPIYARILTDYFQPLESDLQASILINSHDLRQHIIGEQLEMDELLSQFRQFVERRGREAFKVTPMPQEATGQYLLMAYLDLLVRQIGGDLFTEIDSGEGRMDLIVVYRGHRYVVETKMWYGQAKFDQGVEQLEAYLETEGASVGYLVVFHARPNVYGKLTPEQLEFVIEREKSKIKVYFVRLGVK